ncbi:MAG: hypothetical protein CMJ36_03670 [Phycisphaerae bacterium]|nr:hypothetical protein [Phycisphaerae bacterium]
MPVSISPQRILLVRPSALGDVCRTVPVLSSLKHAFPDARIDWIVNDTFVDAIRAHPALNEAIPFHRRRLAGWWYHPGIALELRRFLRGLKRTRYDLVLDCQGLGRSGLITWMTRAPQRIGDAHAREGAGLGYTTKVDTSSIPHDVDRMLALLPACGVEIQKDMQLHVPDDSRADWEGSQVCREVSGSSFAVLAPASRWKTKAWPTSRWAQLADELLDGRCEHVLIVGSSDERDEAAAVRSAVTSNLARVHDVSGSSSIGMLMAMIEDAAVTVSNDSAPLHMAAGLGGRCVGLYGPTDPSKVGPYGLDDHVVRVELDAPVHYRDRSLGDSIMRRITVEEVLERVDEVRTKSAKARR